MSGLVEGKVAVVTGGSSGIGRAIAESLAREGAKAIVIADIRDTPREGGTPTHEQVACEGRFVECDVTRPADLERAVAAADEFGGIDIMINNAGIALTGSFLEFTEEQFDRQMAVNAKGCFFGTQAAARKMVEKGEGAIVNISSMVGYRGALGVPAYPASKAAVKLITYTAARELAAQGVRVNAVHPGVIATEMVTGDFGLPKEAATQAFPIPVGRAAEPAEVGDAVVLLCSPHARYMHASSVEVDGGTSNTVG